MAGISGAAASRARNCASLDLPTANISQSRDGLVKHRGGVGKGSPAVPDRGSRSRGSDVGANDPAVSFSVAFAMGRTGRARRICQIYLRLCQMSLIIRLQATGFGATMKGRTGGLESEGSPEGFGLPSLTG